MGNTPSNTRSPHSQSHSASPSGSLSPSSHESSRAPSRKGIQAQAQSQRSAAAPEPSLAQARGTTVTTTSHRPRQSQSIPSAVLNLTLSNQSNQSPSSSSPAQDSNWQTNPQPLRPQPKLSTRDRPSQPVDVPIPAPNPDTSSLRSYSQSIEASGLVPQDMSYHLTRPPRLPLPIEEEVHTPGSPIIAPQDADIPPLDSDSLDQDILPRRASALSNTTIDEEDAEELRVDRTKATVPTTFEWLEGKGGEKVYVTGTIFQWNKKHRLHPM